MKKSLKSFFKFIVLVCLALALFFYRDWVKENVVNRAIGMYYVFKGDRAYHKHKLAYSIEYYKLGLKYFPKHYTAWNNLGSIYVVYEDYYSAVEAYEEAVKYNPRYVMARMNLGIVQAEKLGNFDEAIKQYEAILNIKTKIWEMPFVFSNKKSSKQNMGIAYYNKGLAYRGKARYLPDADRELEMGLLRKAAESYEKSHKILKKNSDVVYNLALTYHVMGSYRDAGINYCKAIALTPMNYEAHYNLAILLRRLKRYKESMIELEKASMLLSFYSNDPNKAGYILGIMGNVSQLYRMYDYQITPNDLDALYNTDNQYVDTKKKKKKKKKKDELVLEDENIIEFHKGRVVPAKDIDKSMLKNFKMCSGMDYFKHEVDDE